MGDLLRLVAPKSSFGAGRRPTQPKSHRTKDDVNRDQDDIRRNNKAHRRIHQYQISRVARYYKQRRQIQDD